MCKSFIFETIFSAVISETEISREQIESHNKQADVVEARRMLLLYLQRAGFYPSQIARLLGQSRQSVNSSLKSCKNLSKIAKIYCKKLDTTLAEYLLPPPKP